MSRKQRGAKTPRREAYDGEYDDDGYDSEYDDCPPNPPQELYTASSLSHVREGRKCHHAAPHSNHTDQTATTMTTTNTTTTTIPLWDKLNDDERGWVKRYPASWRTPDPTPAPEPVTGSPHDHFSFGSEQEVYWVGDGETDDIAGYTSRAGTAADDDDAWSAAIESYTPHRAAGLSAQLGTVQRVASAPTGDAAAAEREEMRPMVRRQAARRAYRDKTWEQVEQALSDADLLHPLTRPPRTPRRETVEWTSFLGGRKAQERQQPQRVTSRRAWQRAEAQRQAAERAEAMRQPPLVDTDRAAYLLGITPSAVRQWVKRKHIAISKIEGKNYYRLSDVMRYAAQFLTPVCSDHPSKTAAA